MKLKILLIAALLITSISAQVEHAPTVAQCQADQRLWLSKIEEAATTDSHSSLPKYLDIEAWSREMSDCEKVDAPNFWKYYNTQGEVWVGETLRLEHFLKRNHMWDIFIEEDAAGKR